jgi:hypothetical protein
MPDTDPKLEAKEKEIEEKAEKNLEDQIKNDLSPAIWKKYHELGGEPVFGTQLTDLTFHAPATVTLTFQHGLIAAERNKGVHGVVGGFYAKWKQVKVLGFPSSDQAHNAQESHQWFRGDGLLVQENGKPTPFAVWGKILDKYKQLGGAAGWLGCPVNDETKTPDGKGSFNHFEHRGSIYEKSTSGVHEVHGLIRDFWAGEGWEKSKAFGWPISDELPTKTGSVNRFSNFENGVVHWTSGDPHAALLKPKDTQTAADVISKIASNITSSINNMGVPDEVKDDVGGFMVTSGPSPRNSVLFGSAPASGPFVSDYKVSGGHTMNRRYMFTVGFDIIVSGGPDISVDLDVDVEIFWGQNQKMPFSRLTGWWIKSHVPWPTSWSVGAETVGKAIDKALQSAAKPKVVQLKKSTLDLLQLVDVLTVKTMPDGSLDTYAVFK